MDDTPGWFRVGRGKADAGEYRAGCQVYARRLRERLGGLNIAESPRLNTAQATLSLADGQHADEGDGLIGVLASAEVATSEAAMGTCLKHAAELAATLETFNWEILDAEPEPAKAATPTPTAAPIPSRPSWLDCLLASLFAAQKKLGGRAVPEDAAFDDLLSTLDGASGKLTTAALARKLGLPAFRLRGLLAVAQRVSNIDGFAVLGRGGTPVTISPRRRQEIIDALRRGTVRPSAV